MKDETKKPKKSRARKAASKKANSTQSAMSLIRALEFISVAQKKTGPTALQFCKISNGWIAASNEILTVGYPIAEDLEACPNTHQFLEALKEAGKDESLSITQLTGTALAVTSAAFRGLVPCVDAGEIQLSAPDPMAGKMTDSIKAALYACGGLVSEAAQFIAYAAVLLKPGFAVGCTGQALAEYWHGLDLPGPMLIPKAAAKAVENETSELVGFGFSDSSLTFYFENGAFIKTQLYKEKYPEYQNLFEGFADINWWPVPIDFLKGLKALEPFGKGIAFLENETLYSDESKESASSYKVEGLPGKATLNIKQFINMIDLNLIEHIYFSDNGKIFFKNENSRGVSIGA